MSASGGTPPSATTAAAVGAAAAPTGQQRAVIDTTRAIPAAQAASHEPVEEEYYEPPRRNGVFFAMLAILLFDEADALFGKRSEVRDSHDRYANLEVSYLLQRLEAYPGLAILTSNFEKSLDGAFLRRLRFVVPFPFPGAAERVAACRARHRDGSAGRTDENLLR